MSEKKENSKQLFEVVSSRVDSMLDAGGIKLPQDYAVGNALKSAWLMLEDQLDRNNKPVLEVCTKASIGNALLKMVVQGMDPMKSQCYFIPYGQKLTFQRSYQGNYALAKRVGNVVEANSNVIYEGDEYVSEINTDNGRRRLVKHDSPFQNRDDQKIIGVYAVVLFKDGSSRLEEMTFQEVKSSWAMGATKGNSPAHSGFSGEMTKKTMLNRSFKTIINSSSDSILMEDDEEQQSTPINEEVKENANKHELGFVDAEFQEVPEQKETEKKPDPVKPSKKKEEPKGGDIQTLEFE